MTGTACRGCRQKTLPYIANGSHHKKDSSEGRGFRLEVIRPTTLLCDTAPFVILLASHCVRFDRTRDPPQVGLLLVQMKHGLWGLIPESVLPITSKRPVAGVISPTTATPPSHADRTLSVLDERRSAIARTESKSPDQEIEDVEIATLEEGNTTSSLFYAWPPLSCVVERYSHHVLSHKRRKVFCLTDSGLLDTYLFGPAKGEAHKTDSRKVDLHANGATATCMCLLQDTPACVVAALERFLASHTPVNANFDGPGPGDDADDGGDNENYRDRPCGKVRGRNKANQIICENDDQMVAIGTSHGGVILVETIVNGTVRRDPSRTECCR